ncbi:MAG: tRNA pseudouridine(38-40) synthase TruA [Pseudomonadota bacterium]|nr:tRNA pseudouridine(38-40) synthase TruA [Pseudomonadota bacterium]
MPRVKLLIEYDGADYVGWQRQKKGKTVQEEIENCLEDIYDEKIRIFVAGRTDAGVHALGQVAHFDIDNSKIEEERIFLAINNLLKKKKNKISILKSQKVSSSFDSRFSVKEKVYLYKILNRSTPSFILNNRVWFVPMRLNLKSMTISSKILIGRFDFNAFRSSHCQAKNPIRSIKDIRIKKNKECIEIRIVGRSFLHNQVRIIVGTLVDVGKELLDKKRIKDILKSKDRTNAGPTAPACGLYLEKIIY